MSNSRDERAPAGEPTTICLRCRQPLTARAALAPFCPHCGLARDASETIPYEDLTTLRHKASAQLAGADSGGLEHVHSLMLLGYANALLKLGCRYERGSGVARNAREAERCYLKSAKLGNVLARARLTKERLAEVVRREAKSHPQQPLPVEPIE